MRALENTIVRTNASRDDHAQANQRLLAGLVIIFAVLAFGAGYFAFFRSPSNGIGIWDVAFALSILTFLVMFTRLLARMAEMTMDPSQRRYRKDNGKRRLRRNNHDAGNPRPR